MKPTRLPSGFAWFVSPKEIRELAASRPDVQVYWLGGQPPHPTALAARWIHNPGHLGPIGVWVGAVTDEDHRAITDRSRRHALDQLDRWMRSAVAAAPGWQLQSHMIEWRVEGREVVASFDLDPAEHQA